MPRSACLYHTSGAEHATRVVHTVELSRLVMSEGVRRVKDPADATSALRYSGAWYVNVQHAVHCMEGYKFVCVVLCRSILHQMQRRSVCDQCKVQHAVQLCYVLPGRKSFLLNITVFRPGAVICLVTQLPVVDVVGAWCVVARRWWCNMSAGCVICES
jgi:hypothetical protein